MRRSGISISFWRGLACVRSVVPLRPLLASLVVAQALFVSLAGAQSPATPDAKQDVYVLQKGDSIEVKVFNVADLTETVTIRPDGRISLLLLDEVEAAGLTTMKLDEIITAQYAKYYRDPQVTIIVKTFVNQKVYVGGEVTTPGMVALAGELTAVRAVLQAGGLKTTAKADAVILLRNAGAGPPVMTLLNLREIFEKGRPDYPLQAFDVVYAPRTRIAKANEFVDKYIKQLVPITLTAGFSYLLNNPLVGTVP
jgi:protein involved in polysaccharide export with SLBB domain